jgi:hypothetical protein
MIKYTFALCLTLRHRFIHQPATGPGQVGVLHLPHFIYLIASRDHLNLIRKAD